ncbi:MAG: bifunctional oligoribonuclease/PAP phosphatase NrnA [Bacillota bacterium]|nr:bifunctional oligoribonuclease/PAP phosphatase NrnA [Bacillota bacterium]
MKNNVSLKEIGEALKAAESVLIFPHVNPDGDALGSAAALCCALRRSGKNAWILMEEETPEYIGFLDKGYCTRDKDCVGIPDVCICVDCSEEDRFPGRADAFRRGKVRLTLDHHAVDRGAGDYYYVDPSEAAAAQIVFKLLKEMGEPLESAIAEPLYAGIVTDTGSFQYSNTTAETHRIVGELFEAGIDHTGIMIRLYQNVSFKKVELQRRILETMEVFAKGRAAIAYVTEEMLKETGAVLDDAEGTVDILRNIEGVEIAAFLKEKPEEVKVSMRAKSYGNVDVIARKFGGGGHIKAAGCTMELPVAEAADILKKEIIASFGALEND